MEALFVGGRVIDLILALMAVEAVVLAAVHHAWGHGVAPVRLWPNLFAGACLMLALRASLTGAGATAIGSWLVLSLVGHLVDLAQRWQRGSTPL